MTIQPKFNYKDTIEESLKSAAEDASKKLAAPVVFGHVVYGKLSQSGSLRLSRTEVLESGNSFLSDKIKFKEHIKKVGGRSKTFLDFLLQYWYEGKSFDSTNDVSRTFTFLIKQQVELLEEPQEDTINVNKELADALAPLELVEKYFKVLKKELDPGEATFYINKLDACTYKALELFLEEDNKNSLDMLEKLSGGYAETKKGDEVSFNLKRYFHLLEAMQSALLFVRASYTNKSSDIGFISNSYAFYIMHKEKKILSNPIIILSATCTDKGISQHRDLNLQLVKKPLQDFTAEKTFYSHDMLGKVENHVKNHMAPFTFLQTIKNIYENNKSVKINTEWSTFIIYWCAVLIQQLRNSIHEGHPLNFTFVVGDVTEIKDSNLFDIIHLDFEDTTTNIFHPFNNGTDLDNNNFPNDKYASLYDNNLLSLQKLIDNIKRNISKKNYSWFLDGKYALLWDATFPSKYPHSLIHIKNSSWEVLINEIRNNRAKEFLSKVSISLTFVRKDQSGGLIIDGKLVSSFRRNSHWSIGSVEKDTNVKKMIDSALKSWQFPDRTALIDLMTDVIISISDDPNAGCILVFSKEKPKISSMGSPWRTRANTENSNKEIINPMHLSKDELEALMSMDGATCIYLDNENPVISFRNILTVSGDDDKMRNYTGHELDGEGSRKWSSLNTIKMPSIDLVVTVSQDGPIYIYYAKEGNEVDIKKIE